MSVSLSNLTKQCILSAYGGQGSAGSSEEPSGPGPRLFRRSGSDSNANGVAGAGGSCFQQPPALASASDLFSAPSSPAVTTDRISHLLQLVGGLASHTTCRACQGYYGSCHEQPYCPTCHAFLFPTPDDEQNGRQHRDHLAAPAGGHPGLGQPPPPAAPGAGPAQPPLASVSPGQHAVNTLIEDPSESSDEDSGNEDDQEGPLDPLDEDIAGPAALNGPQMPNHIGQNGQHQDGDDEDDVIDEQVFPPELEFEPEGDLGVPVDPQEVDEGEDGDDEDQGSLEDPSDENPVDENDEIHQHPQNHPFQHHPHPHHENGEGPAGPSDGNGVHLHDRNDPLAQQLRLLCFPAVCSAEVNPDWMDKIPSEVFIRVFFPYLDDLSLWCCSQVCKRWATIVRVETSDAKWQEALIARWPLVRAERRVRRSASAHSSFAAASVSTTTRRSNGLDADDIEYDAVSSNGLPDLPGPSTLAPNPWYRLYTQLALSAPCLTCLWNLTPTHHVSMHHQSSAHGHGTSNGCATDAEGMEWMTSHPVNHAPSNSRDPPSFDTDCCRFRTRRLRSEWRAIQTELHNDSVELWPLDPQYSRWLASILGPKASPYEGGKFYLLIQVSPLYPMRPPSVRFLSRILHPNVSPHGDIGLDILQHQWSLALTLSKVLISIQSLMCDPNPEVCMVPELGELFRQERFLFDAIATAWTMKFATCEANVAGPFSPSD